jgi:propionaldehyde dehydrogenase
MKLDQKEVNFIIEEVLKKLTDTKVVSSGSKQTGTGIYDNMDNAIDAAYNAQKELVKLGMMKRKEIIEQIRRVMRTHVRLLSEAAVAETGMGRVDHKINKNLLAIDKTPGVEDLSSTAYTGDRGLALVEMAPYGLIGSITPSTNSSETIINNSISMISAGNSVVFGPHPAAKGVSQKTVELLNGAIQSAGGPVDLVTTVSDPSIEASQTLMKHQKVRLLVVTGGPGVVELAMKSGKKVIAAGPGNPPVVVDETADIPGAARDIVLGAGLDNNIVCIAEKEIFALKKIADHLKSELCRHGACELSSRDLDKLMEHIMTGKDSHGHGVANRNLVGRNASVIASIIGLRVPEETKILIAEVPPSHPLVMMEQLMPVIPFSRFDSFDDAIAWSLRAEHGFYHTSSIHSKNVENLSIMASVVNTTIFVKNAPTYAGIGMGGEGHTTFTIASPTGEGLTSARTFTRQRRCTLVDYFRII